MSAIGKVGSYATTQAPQDNIMQAMQYVDQLDYRAKQDKAAQAQAQAKAQAEKEKEIVADLEKIKALPTGNRGYDAPVIEATTKLSERYADYARDYAAGKMSKTEFKVRSNHLLSQVSLMNEKSKLVIDKYKTFDELLKNDKLEKGFEDGAMSLGKTIDNGQIYTEMDENDNIVMIAYDVDENGNKVIVEKNGLADFGNAKLNPTMKVDFQGEIEKFKKNNALSLQESISGNIKTGIKELTKGSNIDNNIKAFAAARVQDPNFLRIAYRNATGETKYDITDPDDIKLAEDWVYNQIYDSYSKEINKDEAMGRANLGLGYARLKQDEEKKPEPIITQFDGQAALDDFAKTGKKESVKLGSYYPNMISFSDNRLKFRNLQGKDSGINNGFVNGFVLRKDGEIVVTGKALIDKGQKFKVGGNEIGLVDLQELANQGNKEAQLALDSYSTGNNYGNFTRKVSNTELAGLANEAGYSPEQLKKELKKLNNNPETKPKVDEYGVPIN